MKKLSSEATLPQGNILIPRRLNPSPQGTVKDYTLFSFILFLFSLILYSYLNKILKKK